MTDFNEKDVYALADAVIAEAVHYEDSDSHWGWWCLFCAGHVYGRYNQRPTKFPHAPNCDVRVAEDILTGRNES